MKNVVENYLFGILRVKGIISTSNSKANTGI